MNRQKFIKNIAVISFSALILGTAGQSEAVTYSSAFPEGKAIGPLVSEFKTPISIQNSTIVNDITVTIDLEHSWAGDVIVDLIGPDNRRLNLIAFNSDLDDWDFFAKGNRYAFSDHGTTTLPEYNNSQELPGDLYKPHANTSRAADQDPTLALLYNKSFSDWAGLLAKGEWQLLVKDTYDDPEKPNDWQEGSLYSWSIDINPITTTGGPPPEVPIPGALWLFGSAVVSIVGLRKRSRQS